MEKMTERIKGVFAGLGALWIALAPGAFAQQVDVGLKMDLDKREVQVGETLTVTLEFRQVGSGNLSVMGDPSIATPSNFEIRGQSSTSSITMVQQQTAVISTTHLRLVATKPGQEVLGPAILIYQDAQGQKAELKSNVAMVTVVEKKGLFGGKKNAAKEKQAAPQQQPQAPPAPPEDELRDIKPLVPESHTGWWILFWLFVLVLLAGFIRRMLKRQGKSTAVKPLEEASRLRDAWKRLGKEELSSKDFCLGLSSLVRECLAYRFGFPAVDLTTEEILRVIAKHKMTEEESSAVEKCLKACDRVLYADGNLTGRENLRGSCQVLLPKMSKN